ncbi:MAG TPA: tol-pal system protein YbgF [Geomobilimonas sp.]|nr:tol-pal system protein YbgF [Geomobilimonas sp.]
MRSISWVVVAGLAFAASGCSEYDVILKKQTEMDARLEQLVQGSAAANKRLAELSGEVKDLQARAKTQSAELDELKTVAPQLKDLKSSVETLSPKVNEPPPAATPRIEVVNSDAVPPDTDAAPQEAYMKAFGLFSSNRYNEAIDAFDAFIRNHPTHEYAGNAQYWIGECHYSQRNYPMALEAFEKVVSGYPKGAKVPDAMLKAGYTLISMNETARAKATLKALVEKYPKSPAAAKARERLGRL